MEGVGKVRTVRAHVVVSRYWEGLILVSAPYVGRKKYYRHTYGPVQVYNHFDIIL